MKKFLLAAGLIAFSGHVAAQTCIAQASDKKLSGAAQTSFIKKCEKDAKASCEVSAGEKKLAGAAKNSFVTKCVKDAVGSS